MIRKAGLALFGYPFHSKGKNPQFLILFYKQMYRFYARTEKSPYLCGKQINAMMRKYSLFLFLVVAIGAVCCTRRNELNPDNPDATVFSRSLSVINEDYYELLILDEIAEPVTVASTRNIPYWLDFVVLEGVNAHGHPILRIDVKKDAQMTADRKMEGIVNFSSGDALHITVKQGGDLPTGMNDDSVLKSCNLAFETDWASAQTISLVTSYEDMNGRTQVTSTEVALPWATGSLTEEWLPEGEAESMVQLKDQWELVFNLTGIESRPNYNYFGLYNKYTGKLRIFYYMDRSHMPSSDANDHMWSLYFSDALAEYPVFQFGIPYEVSASSAYKQALGAPNIQFMTSATTNQMSQTYKVTPRIGWWAFDVDMSQLRPTNLSSKNGYITPGMLLYAQDNVYLNSVLNGDVRGSISGNINLNALAPAATNESGFSITNLTSRGESMFSTKIMAYMLMGSVSTAPLGIAISRGGLGACMALGGIMDYLDTPEGPSLNDLGKVKLDAQLNLNAQMQTQGTIGGERSNNISSPKIPKEYILQGTHFGEGVWNIENNPVIYVLSDAYWSDVKNFLTYERQEEKDASGQVIRTYYKTVQDPSLLNIRQISFLDPTSMGKALVNDKVYDVTSEVHVIQSFGVFPGASAGHTRTIREGLGIPARTTPLADAPFDTRAYKNITLVKRPVDDTLFDYGIPEDLADMMAPRLSQQSDDSNAELVRQYFGPSMYYFKVNPPVTEVDKVQYVADPQVKLPYIKRDLGNGMTEYNLYDPDYVDWVVTVNLQIEQEGRMYVLSRQFIPEVKTVSYKDLPALIDQMKTRQTQLAGSANYVAADDMIARVQQYYDAIVESIN